MPSVLVATPFSWGTSLSTGEMPTKPDEFDTSVRDIILKHGGALLDSTGESFVAAWSGPDEEAGLYAAKTAVEIQNWLFLYQPVFHALGHPRSVGMGVGLHAGEQGEAERGARELELQAGPGMVLATESFHALCAANVLAIRLAGSPATYSIRGARQTAQPGRVFLACLGGLVGLSRDPFRIVKLKDLGETAQALVLLLIELSKRDLTLNLRCAELSGGIPFTSEGEVPISASGVVCRKGTVSLAGSPLEGLLGDQPPESEREPGRLPRYAPW